MKKLYILSLATLFSFGLFAQDSSDGTDKKIQAGIGVGGGVLFQKLGTNKASKDGAGYNFNIGLSLNYNFSKNVGFYTGLTFDFEGFDYSFDASDRMFYNYSDKNVLRKQDIPDHTSYDSLLITNRTYKPISLTIPTMLLFKTNQIGYLKYFGKFGLRTSFVMSQKADDQGYQNGDNALSIENKQMSLKNDLLWIKSSVGLAGGVEWNFSGSHVLVGEIGFYYGITNMHNTKAVGGDSERNYSYYQNVNGAPEYTSLKSNQMQLEFKVAVLF